MSNNKKKLLRLIRQLRKANFDYCQVEHALRLGLQGIKQGVDEKVLEEQYGIKAKELLAQKKELEKILHERNEKLVELTYQSMTFWHRLKFLFKIK